MDFDFMVHLEDLSLSELQELVDDEDKINQFILDDERLKRVKIDRELIMAENRSIADDNLGKEPRLRQLRSALESKYEELKQLHDAFQMNQAKIASLGKEENLDTTLAVLQTKSAECEEKTEELADRLFDGGIEVDNFICEFKQLRRLAHLRHVKTDKMKELMLEIRRNPVTNPMPYPAAPQPVKRNRNPSNPSLNQQPSPSLPYPPHPGYGQQAPHQVVPSYQPPQQSYPQYSW